LDSLAGMKAAKGQSRYRWAGADMAGIYSEIATKKNGPTSFLGACHVLSGHVLSASSISTPKTITVFLTDSRNTL